MTKARQLWWPPEAAGYAVTVDNIAALSPIEVSYGNDADGSLSVAAAGLVRAINSMNGDPADTRVKIRPVSPSDLYLADERIRIKTGTRVVAVDHEPVQITPTPKSLLAYLAFHVDKPRTNAQILSDVWDIALPEDSDKRDRAINLIEQNLRRVRRALGDELGDSYNGAIIWIRNAGYCALSTFS